MKAWPSIGLLLLIGCSLDTAPDHTGKPAAEEYPDWRPSALDAGVKADAANGAKSSAASRDAGTSALHVDASPAKADTSNSTPPAADGGRMDSPPPPISTAVIDAATANELVDAGVRVTMTMNAPAEPPPPEMNGSEEDGKGERGDDQGEDHGNRGKSGEGERVDASAPPQERAPAEGTHTSQSAARPVDIVTSIVEFALGAVDGSVAAELVIDLLALAGAPDDALVAAVLTESLRALDQAHVCRGRNGVQCLATCELLASDCGVCAGDASCLGALADTCGNDSVRACE